MQKDLLRAQRDGGALLGGQRQRLVATIAVQRLRAPEHRGQGLERHADDVVVRLLRCQCAAGRLGVKTQLLCARAGGAESVTHDARPHPAGGAIFCDLVQEIVVRVEEEREALPALVDIETSGKGRLHVRAGVRQREGDLLHRCRAGLTDVVSANRDRVPLRQFALAVGHHVGDDPERGTRWIDVGAASDVFLQDVVLHGSRESRERDALPPRHANVEGEEDDGRRVDRHRGRDPPQRNLVEERRHVLNGINRHTDFANLSGRKGMVRVVADLSGEVEGDAEAADSLGEKVAVTPVGFGGVGESRVLTHGPGAAPVHVRLDAASKWELARSPDVTLVIEVGQGVWGREGPRLRGGRHAPPILPVSVDAPDLYVMVSKKDRQPVC